MGGPWEDYAAPKQPRGIRNNNPGNIEDGPFARSIPGYKGSDGRFAIFESPQHGAEAQTRLLQSYGRRGFNTVEGIVNRWAPPTENDTGAYVNFVSQKLGVDPRQPLDMNDPRVLGSLRDAISAQENGQPIAANDAPPWVDYGGAAAPRPGQPGAKPPPQIKGNATPLGRGYADPKDVAALATKRPLSPALSVVRGMTPYMDKLLPYSPANLVPGFKERAAADLRGLHAKTDGQQAQAPYQFAGSVAASVPAMMVTKNPMLGGALTGALGSEEKDLGGIAKDTVIGGVTGRLTAGAMDAAQLGLRHLLSKAPKVMTLAELQAAKKAAYDLVDQSGFRFQPAEVKALADGLEQSLASRALSKTAKDDARSIITYARQLSKGELSLSQLEKLRGDIYAAMVKGKQGTDTAALGEQFRARIDAMIDGSGDDLVREARSLNARYKKADVVSRASQSADIRAEKDYGGDYGRKLKDRLFPLIDPQNAGRNLRGATADERAAVKKLVTGTKTQNATSMIAGMLDPRRMGGKILTGITGTGGGAGAPFTGGASLLIPAAQMGTGLGLTKVSSDIARKNLDDLLRLISVGGSRQALGRVPTRASYQAEKAVASARPAAAAAAPALVTQRKKKR